MGPNGVGKTTALRLIPLFFGHLPSALVHKQVGQSPMIPFILPTPQSALVFEYQRGDDAEGVRLAVIRARAQGSEGAEYRLLMTGYREDLFVRDGVFLDDAESMEQAKRLGIAPSEKLTAAEYRHVILGVRALNQRQKVLRQLSREFALGPKPLPNLDRVVAAMIKDHVSFGDLIQVSVGMILENIGVSDVERDRVFLKQRRDQIERWLVDRKACAEARALQPAVHRLGDLVRESHAQQEVLRGLKADVACATELRREQATAAGEQLKSLNQRRAEAEAAEEARQAELDGAAAAKRKEYSEHKAAADDAALEEQGFSERDAQGWALRLDGVPGSRGLLEALVQERGVLTRKAEGVEGEIQRMKLDLATQEARQQARVVREQTPIRKREAAEIKRIDNAEATARKELEALTEAKVERLEKEAGELGELIGAAQLRVQEPRVPVLIEAEAGDAAASWQRLLQARVESQAKAAAASLKEQRARQAFDVAEQRLQRAREMVASRTQELDRTTARLTPPAASLLAALKASPGQEWQTTLAKVIDPQLLERTDLEPVADEEGSGSAYGWSLNLSGVALPAWADDEAQRGEIRAAQRALEAAREQERAQQRGLEEASQVLQTTEEAQAQARAADTMALRRASEAETKKLAADGRRTLEATQMVSAAREELSRLRKRADEVRQALARIKAAARSESEQVGKVFEQERVEVRRELGDALVAVERAVAEAIDAIRLQMSQLDVLRLHKLEIEGVDVERLENVEKQIAALQQEIEAAELNRALVLRWKQWIAEGGSVRVAQLKSAADAAHRAVVEASNAAESHRRACVVSRKTHEQQAQAFEQAEMAANKELTRLMALEDALTSYSARRGAKPDDTVTAAQLEGRVRDARSQLKQTTETLESEVVRLRNQLTGAESRVSELVQHKLAEVASESVVMRAQALIEAHRQIEPQVVANVGTTLRSMLEGIGSFRGTIQRFETEVTRFNARLQKGLEQVSAFHRLRDLELRITTDFGALDILKKVDRLDELIRQTRLRDREPNWLPDESAAAAMSDFMSSIEDGGRTEVSLASRVTLRGKVTENGQTKPFNRAEELKHISSTGLSSLVMITLLIGMLNMIRGDEAVYVAWVTNEVAQFDPENFAALLQMLKDNRVDVVTASPDLNAVHYRRFARRYQMGDRGRIRQYAALANVGAMRLEERLATPLGAEGDVT